MKVVFTETENQISQKSNKYKIALFIGLAVFMVVMIFLFIMKFNKNNGYKSKEELISAVITATYENDFEAVMNTMPKQFKEKLEEKAVIYYDTEEDNIESIVDKYNDKFEEYISNLDMFYGESDTEEMWSMNYEIKDYHAYTNEELSQVRQILNMSGIDRNYKIDEYGIVTVHISIIPAYEHKKQQEHDIFIPVLCHNGLWFSAQNYGTYAEEKLKFIVYDLYGSLFDGFIIDGTIDQYGYKILDTENGVMVRWNPEYESYAYTDMYGNIHLCTENLKDTKVIGPDGGDPIDEEEYNKLREEYLSELEELDEHIHDEETISDNSVE